MVAKKVKRLIALRESVEVLRLTLVPYYQNIYKIMSGSDREIISGTIAELEFWIKGYMFASTPYEQMSRFMR